MMRFRYKDPKALEKSEKTTGVRELYTERNELVYLHVDAEFFKAWEIFNGMPEKILPPLPPGYQWARASDKYSVIREKTTPKHKLLLVLYGPDTEERINFVFQVDGVTTYSLAHTRKDGSLEKRDSRSPIKRGDFRVVGYDYSKTRYKEHVHGHLIDYQDTIVENDRDHSSAYDARNFIPEPPEYEWGLGIRRLKVGALRRKRDDSAYAQFSCYAENPLRTVNGTPAPEYVYFYAYKQEEGEYKALGIYNVEWEENLSRPRGFKVLDYADKAFVTSPEAAPIVASYVSKSPDRAFRYQGRMLFFKAQRIANGEIASRFPEKDGLFAQCLAGDVELDGSSRKMLASVFAAEEKKDDISRGYVRRSLEYGEDLIGLDNGQEILSAEAVEKGSALINLTAATDETEDLIDRMKKISTDQHSPRKKH